MSTYFDKLLDCDGSEPFLSARNTLHISTNAGQSLCNTRAKSCDNTS